MERAIRFEVILIGQAQSTGDVARDRVEWFDLTAITLRCAGIDQQIFFRPFAGFHLCPDIINTHDPL